MINLPYLTPSNRHRLPSNSRQNNKYDNYLQRHNYMTITSFLAIQKQHQTNQTNSED